MDLCCTCRRFFCALMNTCHSHSLDSFTLTLAHSHSLHELSLSHARTFSHALRYSSSEPLTHSHSQYIPLAQALTHSVNHSRAPTHSHIHSPTPLSQSLSHALTQPLTHTHSLSQSPTYLDIFTRPTPILRSLTRLLHSDPHAPQKSLTRSLHMYTDFSRIRAL